MLNSSLTEEQKMIRNLASEFAEKEIKEVMAGIECPRNFACYTSDFKPRCKVKDVELNNLDNLDHLNHINENENRS